MSIQVPKSISITNSKFSSMIMKDGNLHFSDDSIKRILSTNSATVAADSNCFSNSYSSYPAIDSLNDGRPNISSFGVPMNPYLNGNMIGYPMIHPYLLESMQQAEHLSGPGKPQFPSRMFSLSGPVENFLDLGPHPRRKNATRETTSILKAWLNEHQKNPYPTKGEKIMLAVITKMTLTQVSTWFANARRRLKKENKMTWSPNHKSDDEMDDLDDGDSTDLLNTVSQDMATQSVSANDFLLKLSKFNDDDDPPQLQRTSDLNQVPSKPKIWSIADLASSDSHHSEKSKVTTSMNDNINPVTGPSTLPQSFLHNPAMQYWLWKHKELYQLHHFSNIVNNIHRYRPPGDIKNRLSEEDTTKPQDTICNDF